MSAEIVSGQPNDNGQLMTYVFNSRRERMLFVGVMTYLAKSRCGMLTGSLVVAWLAPAKKLPRSFDCDCRFAQKEIAVLASAVSFSVEIK